MGRFASPIRATGASRGLCSDALVTASVVLLTACASFSDADQDGTSDSPLRPSNDQRTAAERVCAEARRQLSTIDGGDEIVLTTCEAQSDGESEIGMVFVFNDYLEWTTLLASSPLEDLIYTIPLALMAYGFALSHVDPAVFDRILLMFPDDNQTVYDMVPGDLDDVLASENADDLESALLALRDAMRITSLAR